MFKVLVIVSFLLSGKDMTNSLAFDNYEFTSIEDCTQHYGNIGIIAKLYLPGMVKKLKKTGQVYSVTLACRKI